MSIIPSEPKQLRFQIGLQALVLWTAYGWAVPACFAETADVPVVSHEELPLVEPEAVGLSTEKLGRLDDVIETFVNEGKVAGAVVMVARRGQVARYAAYGKKDVAGKLPMQRDTIFRMYSMTKPITTVAAMMLWEEGKIQLDEPVSLYLPQFKGLKVYAGGEGEEASYVEARREISIRDLMRHTSGLTYGRDAEHPVERLYLQHEILDRNRDLSAMMDLIAKIPLKLQPGTKFEYGVSTDVLGRVVEVVSNRPLDEFFIQRIFKPLDMKDTGFSVPDEKLDRFATNYGPDEEGGLTVVDLPAESRYRQPPKLLSGGGGLVSTARDYMRFCAMLLAGGQLGSERLLKPETVALMTRNHIPEETLPIRIGGQLPDNGFGLGFRVIMQEEPGPRGEYGWGGAASTHFWISPQDEIAVVALEQYMPFTDRIAKAIQPIVYEAIID